MRHGGRPQARSNNREVIFRDLLNLLRPSLPTLPTDERRETMRLRCKMGALAKVDDGMHFVSILDVTLTGLRLEMESALKPEQKLTLTRDEFGLPLEATVMWCEPCKDGKHHRLGVQYKADHDMLVRSWLKPALKQAGFVLDAQAEFPGEKRKLVRIAGRVDCEIKGLTGETYTGAEMLDLSLGGALVECAMSFPQGLTIEFETSPLGGLPPLKGLAKIASVQPLGSDGKRWKYGLRFTESKPDVVQKYMATMLNSQEQP